MRQFATLAALLFALPAAAETVDVPSGTYKIDPTHASIIWKVNHFGFSTYTGAFDRAAINATIELDASDVSKSSVNASVQGTAVKTQHPIDLDPRGVDFDAEIASDMFLNAVSHPNVTFESTKIDVTGDKTANITGNLTLNGQTHPIVLATTLNQAADHPMIGKPTIGISATGTIDRTEFGVNTFAGPVGVDVTIEIQGEFVKAE